MVLLANGGGLWIGERRPFALGLGIWCMVVIGTVIGGGGHGEADAAALGCCEHRQALHLKGREHHQEDGLQARVFNCRPVKSSWYAVILPKFFMLLTFVQINQQDFTNIVSCL